MTAETFAPDSQMSRAFELEHGVSWTDPAWRREAGVWASAWHKATAAAQAQRVPLTDDQIRCIFLVNGFTIKEGASDLKPYVYQAARALLEAAAVKVTFQTGALQAQRVPLTDEQIEALRKSTFSTDNPFCPCDSKTMRKAARATERAHGITQEQP